MPCGLRNYNSAGTGIPFKPALTDWLRREIETALANQRNIVPLLLEGFDFGTPRIASQLTGTLAGLKHYNGLSIPTKYFR
jgi:hypothetical protein